ncbi:MAG: histidine triad protein [Solirubrobacteraceae bacterium]|nr:histidine triad protein [Solirubrobacteraceae bacterium]
MAEDCIFCKIVAGDVPATKVFEDDRILAFMDIAPWTRGHALVIPKTHSKDLGEIAPDDLAAVAAGAQRLAALQRERLGAEGVNLLNCYGAAAWQTVFHFHIHAIPRYADDGMVVPARPGAGGDDDAIAAAGRELAA